MNRRRNVADALSEIDQRLEAQGMPLLSEEEKEQIRAKAREHVAKKRKEQAEADYLAAAIREEEREHVPEDKWEDITINLAPFVASQKFNSAFLAIDGTRYFHGITYTVTYNQARFMEDIMARGWEHEREIHGERRRADFQRRPIEGMISPGSMNINTTSALRRNTHA
jgi:hypothetical protein